jgi:WD40 repeat protein
MNHFFSNSPLAKKMEARRTSLGWFWVGVIMICYTGRAEIIQTTWARQFGLGTLRGAVYSPKGDYVLTYGGGGAYLWSPDIGSPLRQFSGAMAGVTSAAFSPDGTNVLTGSYDRTAKLWSVADGTLLRTFAGDSGEVLSVAFSPDGTQVLTGTTDNAARLWSAGDGTLLNKLAGSPSAVYSVAFAPDASQVFRVGTRRPRYGGRRMRRSCGPLRGHGMMCGAWPSLRMGCRWRRDMG